MSVRARADRAAHLVARYFESLGTRPLDDATRQWVADALEPPELAAWKGMGRVDQAEGVAVARRLEVALAGTPDELDRRWRAAALLHDVGKQHSGFTTFGRVLATAVASLLGARRLRGWVDSSSPIRARVGSYVAHDDLGAALLGHIGARPEVAAWAGAHHRPPLWEGTGIPPGICRALAAADGEPPTRAP
jgi:HD domain